MRLAQLQANVERIKAMGLPNERYIMVNIPGAQIEVVENGAVVSRHIAVVGKVDRQTPLLSSSIHEIRFNPFWTVPASIIKKDLIPKMQKEPTYLTDHHIRIFNQQGMELQPEQVNWHTDEAMNYMFRQDPGDQNSLGFVKLQFHNPHDVYLHDTPAKNLFGSDYRFESSGCVRVFNVRELVAWVLRDTGYNRAPVDETIRSGERLDVEVAEPAGDLHRLLHRLDDRRRPRPLPRRHLRARQPGHGRAGAGPEPDRLAGRVAVVGSASLPPSAPFELRVERVAEAVADQVDGEHGDQDSKAREGNHPPRSENEFASGRPAWCPIRASAVGRPFPKSRARQRREPHPKTTT